MEDLLNIELVKLQDELVQLDKAVSHISKAEQLTGELVTNSREIQQKYINQLQTIHDSYQSFLSKALEANESKLGHFEEKQQAQVDQLAVTLTKYVELGQKTEAVASQHLEQVLAKYNEFLQANTSKTDAVVQQLTAAHEAEMDEVKNLIQGYRTLLAKQEQQGVSALETSLESNGQLLKKSFSATEDQVGKLTDAHKKQLEDVNHVFKTYVSLTESTNKLVREVRVVDFPKRLTQIADNVDEFKNTVRNTFARIESVERNVAKVNQVDWKTIASLSEKLEAQNKKLDKNTYLLYAAVGLSALAAALAVFF